MDQNKIIVRLPNNDSYEYELNESLIAADLIREICIIKYDLNIDENDKINSQVFDTLAIWIVYLDKKIDNSKLQLQLNPNHNLIQMIAKFKKLINFDENIKNDKETDSSIEFRLGRNGYLLFEQEETISNKNLLKILFLEARDNIRNNIYPLNPHILLELWKYECLVEKCKNDESNKSIDLYGTIKKQARKISYSNSLSRERTRRLLIKNAKKMSIDEDISNYDSCENAANIDKTTQSYMKYLDICRKQIPCYGGFTFEAQMERTMFEALIHRNYYDKKVIIRINQNGLHLINVECPKIIRSIKFSELSYEIIKHRINANYHQILMIHKNNDETIKPLFTRQVSFIDKTLEQFRKMSRIQAC